MKVLGSVTGGGGAVRILTRARTRARSASRMRSTSFAGWWRPAVDRESQPPPPGAPGIWASAAVVGETSSTRAVMVGMRMRARRARKASSEGRTSPELAPRATHGAARQGRAYRQGHGTVTRSVTLPPLVRHAFETNGEREA